MSSVVLIIRFVLFAVFVTAAVAKLADLQTSRDTFEAFGVSRRLARPGGTLLPFVELATAILLLPQATVRWGAVAAALLLLAFIIGIAYALSQGLRPNCNCFGQVSSEQIGPLTLGRNAALLVVAVIAIWRAPGASPMSWTTSSNAADLVASVAVLASALLGVLAFRGRQPAPNEVGDPTIDALSVGGPAPDFKMTVLDAEPVTLQSLLARELPIVLIFASQTCGPCIQMMPDIARWSAAMGESLTLALVESGVDDLDSLRSLTDGSGRILTLVEDDRTVAQRYLIRGTPTGIAISRNGTLAAPQALGADAIEALVRATLRQSETRDIASAPIPALMVPAS
jgi:thiol-disulfide isomerase/thioredoxin